MKETENKKKNISIEKIQSQQIQIIGCCEIIFLTLPNEHEKKNKKSKDENKLKKHFRLFFLYIQNEKLSRGAYFEKKGCI